MPVRHPLRRTASTLAALVIGCASLGAALPARAAAVPPSAAAGLVERYFDAFRSQDQGRLAAVTRGPAADETRRMLQTLQDEARRRDVGVELRVQDLRIAPAAPGPFATPVRARFDIAVVAKKWLMSKVARVISGEATFYVENDRPGGASPPRIVDVQMRFD